MARQVHPVSLMYLLWLAAVYVLIELLANSVPAFASYAPPPLLVCSDTRNGDYITFEIDDGGAPGVPGAIALGSVNRYFPDGIHLDPLAQFECLQAQEDAGCSEGGCAANLVFSDHWVTITLDNNSEMSAALTFDRSQLVSGAQLSVSFSVSTLPQVNTLQCQVVATGAEFDVLKTFLFH